MLKNLWNNFLTSGGRYNDKPPIEIFRLKLINVVCITAFISLVSVTSADLFSYKNKFLLIEGMMGILIISIMIILRKKFIVSILATVYCVVVSIAGLFFFLLTTDKDTYRLIIPVLIPILFLLLKGKQVGFIFSLVYYAILISTYFLSFIRYIKLPYTTESIIFLTVGYFSTVLYLYMNQSLVESTQDEVITKNKQLADSLVEINKEVETRKKVQEELKVRNEKLDEKNNELSRMNKIMVDRELKMAEMKNEIAQLKTQLGVAV